MNNSDKFSRLENDKLLPVISNGKESNEATDGNSPLKNHGVSKPTTPDTIRSRRSKDFNAAVKASRFVNVNLVNAAYKLRYEKLTQDCMMLSKTELQKLYQSEYDCLRSRRSQAKARHIKFDDRLKDIRDWLIHLGPRPSTQYTVDRMKNAKGYQPGNLRWATKLQQTQNRRVTRWHLLPDGTRITTKQLASRIGLSYVSTWKRIQRGWTIERLLNSEPFPTLDSWKFPPEFQNYCQPLYNLFRKHHKTTRIEWFIGYMTNQEIEQIGKALDVRSVALQNLINAISKAWTTKSEILKRQTKFEEEKLAELLLILDPPNMGVVDKDLAGLLSNQYNDQL